MNPFSLFTNPAKALNPDVVRGIVRQVNPFDGGATYSNPNPRSSGGGGGGGGGGGWGGPAAPQPKNTSQITGSYSSGGGGGGQAQIDLINSAFGAKRAGLQSQLDVLSPAQKAAEAQALNSYQRQNNELKQNLALGQRNLGTARNTINEKKIRSLKDLGDQFRSSVMGYANQLGAFGAGDSSAAQVINQALGGQVSRNRGDVMGNAAQQLGAVDEQEQSLKLDFDRNMGALTDWKTSTLNQIGMDFAEKRNAIMNAMADADYEQQRQLAQYDAANTQAAIDRLSQLESQYARQAQDLTKRYQNIFAPSNIKMDSRYQNYEVSPIEAGQLEGLRMPTQVNPIDEATAALLRRREEDQLTGTV